MISENILQNLYAQYNRREYVHPDPLEFLYHYPHVKDREIAGLIASCFAYGRVAGILASVSQVLEIPGPCLHDFFKNAADADLKNPLPGFKHRFATDEHLAALFQTIAAVIREYGSLEACFMQGIKKSDETVFPGLTAFVHRLFKHGAGHCGHLIPRPERGSACKRLLLFLRWMVRKDAVDPGGWDNISSSKLIIPLDVHMHRICARLGLTQRKQADMKTALEITSGFLAFQPDDPVRYDFTLSRMGIRQDLNYDIIFAQP